MRRRAGEAFARPMGGWFLGDALYLRYRKAVADRIQELRPAAGRITANLATATPF